ncbi:MAG: DUF1295 domain-containing protein, partial [Cytophagales bacterium]|nr:DUF1295 domain-containing protein [Cytophagales bacterium]
LLKLSAPYGRFNRSGWGIQINNRLGWLLMELFSPMTLVAVYIWYQEKWNGPALFFMSFWLLHYVNRSLIFPFRTKTSGKKMPLVIALSGVFFNSINGYTNGYWFSTFADYNFEWFTDIRFILGLCLFAFGFFINLQSDEILLGLRKPGDTSYKIPQGGFYRWVSCPNYLGEIIEWSGFALMTWSPAAAVFLLWTIANLLPRALSSHQWYLEKFSDYPKSRKAIIPFIL